MEKDKLTNQNKYDTLEIKDIDKKSSLLTGKDILPCPYDKRTVTPNKLIAIWFAMAIEVTIFMSAAQLYQMIPVWEVLLACIVGHLLLFIVLLFTQDMGIKYGIPFAVSLRPSFGYVGAIVAPYFRAIPAMFWFGFQTWVAASAMNEIIHVTFHYDNLTLWIILVGFVQIAHTTLGIEAVTRLSQLAVPMLIAVGIYISYVAFTDFDLSLSEIWTMSGSKEKTCSFMFAALSFTGGWATMSISIMDITKDCVISPEECSTLGKVTKKYLPSQFIGIIPAVVFYTFIGILGAITTGYSDPAKILVAINAGRSDLALVVCLVFILIATWCTNDTANLFPAAYTITNTAPKKITFAMGVVIAGLVGLAMRPWLAADSITDVMVIIGNLLAPVAGIMISDYYFLRKRKINVEDLYDLNGQYKYYKNVNPAAVIALVATTVICWNFGDAQFFACLLLSGILYIILMKTWIIKKYPQPEIK